MEKTQKKPGRFRTRPIHPFMRRLMNKWDCETPAELSDKTGINLYTILSWCDFQNTEAGGIFQSLYDNTRKAEISIDDLIVGLLYEKEAEKQEAV